MTGYTKKQGQYLAYIHHYTQVHGRPPAEADIRDFFGTTAPSVHQMIVKLEEKGLISKIPYTPRSIKILVPLEQIPALGVAVAGQVNLSPLSWSQASYLKAYRFAAEAHQGQLFPGTNLSYLMHLSFVSMEVIACLGIEPHHAGDLALQCALLHDVLEDTAITFPEVEKAFGGQVAQGVLALTKKDTLSKSTAMKDSLRRIRQQPKEVWLVKLADRITNLAPPPHYWSRDKIERYRTEACEIQAALQAASAYLSHRLARKIDEYEMYL